MASLIIPNKSQHEYVVGIDFGHGETSAAICPIEWGKDAGRREAKVLDIDLDSSARKKVITSAICRVTDGILIGDEAFEHMSDNNGIRVCFKQKPESLDGDAEKLMVDYMRTVYARIRKNQDELTDTNHIVYIARPSGWNEENAKELYRQMAIKAGIPLAGLTSESRAAIFYAKSPYINFAKEISKGAIVFDLGSSTLDFTYLSDKQQPIDYGYDLGASIIDEAILQNYILKDEDVCDFIHKYPAYRDALKFKARKFKEDAYGRNEGSRTVGGFPLGNIIAPEEASYDEYADYYVKLRVSNLAELNGMVDSTTHYMRRLKESMIDFRTNRIAGKTVNGVFLTGGASRMNFIRPLVADAFNIPIEQVRIDNDNPSLTISRGIALLGTADATTSILVSELRERIPSLINDSTMLSRFSSSLSSNITDEAWGAVESACSYWTRYGRTTDEEELKKIIETRLRDFQRNRLPTVVNYTLQKFIKTSANEVRRSMNEIISRYAPGREISSVEMMNIGNLDAINKSITDMSALISKVCDSISNILADILWTALGIYLWGIFCAPYYLYKIFRSDEAKRQDKSKKILGKETGIKQSLSNSIDSRLKANKGFTDSVTKSLKRYFTDMIEVNLQQVIIPIE